MRWLALAAGLSVAVIAALFVMPIVGVGIGLMMMIWWKVWGKWS